MCEKERWATPCVSLRSHSHYDSKINLQFYSIRFGWMRKSLAPNEHACWSEGPINWRSNCVWRHVQFSHLLNEFQISLNICICLWPAAIRAGIIVCKLHKAGDMMFCVIRRGKKKKHAYIWRDKCITSWKILANGEAAVAGRRHLAGILETWNENVCQFKVSTDKSPLKSTASVYKYYFYKVHSREMVTTSLFHQDQLLIH